MTLPWDGRRYGDGFHISVRHNHHYEVFFQNPLGILFFPPLFRCICVSNYYKFEIWPKNAQLEPSLFMRHLSSKNSFRWRSPRGIWATGVSSGEFARTVKLQFHCKITINFSLNTHQIDCIVPINPHQKNWKKNWDLPSSFPLNLNLVIFFYKEPKCFDNLVKHMMCYA